LHISVSTKEIRRKVMDEFELIDKTISKVERLACNLVVLTMDDKSIYSLETECFVSTPYGDIYGPLVSRITEEEYLELVEEYK
jgi:hypothetical protein